MRCFFPCTALFTLSLLGCRDDIIAKISLKSGSELAAEETFDGKTGVDYVFWADYNYDSPAGAPGDRYCYQLVVDVIQDDRTVDTVTCGPFPGGNGGNCISSYGQDEGDCETGCQFELAAAGKTAARAKLIKGQPCPTAYEGLIDPKKQINKYVLLLEEDD